VAVAPGPGRAAGRAARLNGVAPITDAWSKRSGVGQVHAASQYIETGKAERRRVAFGGWPACQGGFIPQQAMGDEAGVPADNPENTRRFGGGCRLLLPTPDPPGVRHPRPSVPVGLLCEAAQALGGQGPGRGLSRPAQLHPAKRPGGNPLLRWFADMAMTESEG
jgi:hypothetical protein